MVDFEDTALQHLRTLTANPRAEFRDGQLEAIGVIAADRGRALVVQRTGWGKSAVYFIATKMLREQGAGPTVIVSPLLVLQNMPAPSVVAYIVSGCTVSTVKVRIIRFDIPASDRFHSLPLLVLRKIPPHVPA